MAFEKIQQNVDKLHDAANVYMDLTKDFYELKALKITTKSTTLLVKLGMLVLVLSMVFLFLSLALAFALGNFFDSLPIGFLCVSGLYLLLLAIVFVFKDRWIDRPVLEKLSTIFLND